MDQAMKTVPFSNTEALHKQQHGQLSDAMLGLIPWYQLAPDSDPFWDQFNRLILLGCAKYNKPSIQPLAAKN